MIFANLKKRVYKTNTMQVCLTIICAEFVWLHSAKKSGSFVTLKYFVIFCPLRPFFMFSLIVVD